MRIEDLKENEVIHCATLKEVKRIFGEKNRFIRWWNYFKDKTCYRIFDDAYNRFSYYKDRGYKIIPSTEIESVVKEYGNGTNAVSLKNNPFTLELQTKYLTEQFEKIKEVQLKKGNDYANEDRLSNFKLAGNICGLKAEINCLSLIATKVARLGVLLNSDNEPNNESVADSILDLQSYSLLLGMILKQKEDESRINK